MPLRRFARRRAIRCAAAVLTIAAICVSVQSAGATILPSQVLVVFNSASAEGAALKNAYLAAHPGIPAENVLGLPGIAVDAHSLSQADFVSLVRNPIRAHINQSGPPEPSQIMVILLIRPFPHRVLDTTVSWAIDTPSAGGNEFNNGDCTYASVDSELTLLYQDLDAGEAGGTFDSFSDNVIQNPWWRQDVDFDTFPRAAITTPRTFVNTFDFYWTLGGTAPLTPGEMYLVCRIDGNTQDDGLAEIERARNLYVNRAAVRILLDEWANSSNDLDDDIAYSGDPFTDGPDYEQTRDLMSANGWDVRYDHSTTFITAALETRPLIAYASYGENHDLDGISQDPPGDGVYLDGFNFAPGAIFNTIESYNGRAFNGLSTLFSQEQVADFISNGGTFGVGMVGEPFSIFVPDNQYILRSFLLRGRTWAESAWSGIPALSWQHVVVGDPLARAAIINDPGLPRGDMNGDGRVNGDDIRWFVNVLNGSLASYRTAFPALDPIARGDFTNDYRLTAADCGGFVQALLSH